MPQAACQAAARRRSRIRCRSSRSRSRETGGGKARSRMLTFNLSASLSLFVSLSLSLCSCVLYPYSSCQLSRCNGVGCVSRYHVLPNRSGVAKASHMQDLYSFVCALYRSPARSSTNYQRPTPSADRSSGPWLRSRSGPGPGLGLGLGPLCVNILRHACVSCSHYEVWLATLSRAHN